MAETLAYLCSECPTRDECRRAFGRYYLDKSRNGRGCNHPYPPPKKEDK